MSRAATGQGERPAIFSMAFRPFFLAASIWSALALAIWIAILIRGAALPSRFDPPSWHVHEMLFGFVLGVIAGFILTAIPNWTGRLPVRGSPLARLASVWLLGRVACVFSGFVPLWLAAAVDLAFPAVLCTVAAREIVAGRNWRNLPMTAPIAILGVADLLMYLELAGFATPTGLGWRLGLAAIIVLISVIGGRIIPSFTRNWLAKRGAVRLPAIHGWIDSTSLGLLHAGLIGWVFCPGFRPFGALLLLAAGFNLARLARWRGGATSAEPLLVILHLGYLWLIVGTALLGATMLDEAIPEAAAIHALTVGTIGTMVLAVMTRVSLGHAGRALTADYVTISIYVLVNAAALTRIAAALSGSPVSLLIFSAALWVGSFTLFAIRYGPVLTSHRIRSTLVA